MIVWLASFPRSGNSFFRTVSKDTYGIPIYSIYQEYFYRSPDELSQMDNAEQVYFVKTHELPSDSRPAIYLVRDGRDALVSYTWFDFAFRGLSEADVTKSQFQELLKQKITDDVFGGWSKNALAWVNRPQQTFVMRFEDWITEPERSIADALRRFGATPTRTQAAPVTFEALRQKAPKIFRKGKIGGWKQEMPEPLHKLFWRHHRNAMQAFGYTA